jgi:acetyltransferase-like isoleucine patch superfamily enzyme
MKVWVRRLAKAFRLMVTIVWLKPQFGRIGHRTIIGAPRALFNPEHVFIGNNSLIEKDATFYAITSYNDAKFSPEISIGDRAYINHSFNVTAACRIRIGDDVMLAYNVSIFDSNHGFADPNRPIKDQDLSVSDRGVEIGDGAWIGANAFICAGVRIGRGAVVGANTVVKHDVPDFAVAVGNPAKIVKQMDPATKIWSSVK